MLEIHEILRLDHPKEFVTFLIDRWSHLMIITLWTKTQAACWRNCGDTIHGKESKLHKIPSISNCYSQKYLCTFLPQPPSICLDFKEQRCITESKKRKLLLGLDFFSCALCLLIFLVWNRKWILSFSVISSHNYCSFVWRNRTGLEYLSQGQKRLKKVWWEHMMRSYGDMEKSNSVDCKVHLIELIQDKMLGRTEISSRETTSPTTLCITAIPLPD